MKSVTETTGDHIPLAFLLLQRRISSQMELNYAAQTGWM